jgi:hypothetical protein
MDGGAETNVDFYNATILGDQLLWTSPLLSSGSHTLKVRVTGTKNSAASDRFVVVDRVSATASSTCTTESNANFCSLLPGTAAASAAPTTAESAARSPPAAAAHRTGAAKSGAPGTMATTTTTTTTATITIELFAASAWRNAEVDVRPTTSGDDAIARHRIFPVGASDAPRISDGYSMR